MRLLNILQYGVTAMSCLVQQCSGLFMQIKSPVDVKPPEDLPAAPPPTPVSPPITSPPLLVTPSSDPLESVKPEPDDNVDDDDEDDHDDSGETDAAGGSHEEKDHKLVGYMCGSVVTSAGARYIICQSC